MGTSDIRKSNVVSKTPVFPVLIIKKDDVSKSYHKNFDMHRVRTNHIAGIVLYGASASA